MMRSGWLCCVGKMCLAVSVTSTSDGVGADTNRWTMPTTTTTGGDWKEKEKVTASVYLVLC